MFSIPSFVLKKLYVKGSLCAEDAGFSLQLKNLVAPATIVAFSGLEVDGDSLNIDGATAVPSRGDPRKIKDIAVDRPLKFPIGATVTLHIPDEQLTPGLHDLTVRVDVKEIGTLAIPISDELA